MDTLISCPACAILFRRDSYLRRTHLESRRSWRDRMLEFNDFFPPPGRNSITGKCVDKAVHVAPESLQDRKTDRWFIPI